ncbi:DUF3817 domain-containing protein [Streptomyces hundungensis]
MRARSPLHLHTAAHAELISLVVMLTNVLTVHLKPISSLLGPIHGCAYLFVVIRAWRLQQTSTRAKFSALVPGAGGLLFLRQLDRGGSVRPQEEEAIPS